MGCSPLIYAEHYISHLIHWFCWGCCFWTAQRFSFHSHCFHMSKLRKRKLTEINWKTGKSHSHPKLLQLTSNNEKSRHSRFCLEGEGGGVEVLSGVLCFLHLCVCDVCSVDVYLDAQGWNGWNNPAVQASGCGGEWRWKMPPWRRLLRGRWVL